MVSVCLPFGYILSRFYWHALHYSSASVLPLCHSAWLLALHDCITFPLLLCIQRSASAFVVRHYSCLPGLHPPTLVLQHENNINNKPQKTPVSFHATPPHALPRRSGCLQK